MFEAEIASLRFPLALLLHQSWRATFMTRITHSFSKHWGSICYNPEATTTDVTKVIKVPWTALNQSICQCKWNGEILGRHKLFLFISGGISNLTPIDTITWINILKMLHVGNLRPKWLHWSTLPNIWERKNINSTQTYKVWKYQKFNPQIHLLMHWEVGPGAVSGIRWVLKVRVPCGFVRRDPNTTALSPCDALQQVTMQQGDSDQVASTGGLPGFPSFQNHEPHKLLSSINHPVLGILL
jgi:hypothetical protein